MKLRCYCCGDPLDNQSPIALVSLAVNEVDRVFVFRADHVTRVDRPVSELVYRDYLSTQETETMERPYQQHSNTSAQAAASMKTDAPSLRAQVLDFITRTGGATDEEVQTSLDIAANTQRPRRRELQLDGKVYDSGLTRATRSGRSAVVWMAA